MNIAYTVESARCALGRRLSKGARCRGWAAVAAALLAALCAAPVTQAGPLRPGEILVADSGLEEVEDGAIFRVDPVTGDRAIISGRGVGSGPELFDPLGIVVTQQGHVFVVDRALDELGSSHAVVYQVDPITGERFELSGPNRGAGADLGPDARGLTLDSSGQLLVASDQPDLAPITADGAILRIDPLTGNRSVVTGPEVGAGPTMRHPMGLRVDLEGNLLVTDTVVGVFQISLETGDRTDLTEPFLLPTDLAVVEWTHVLVSDFFSGTIYSVDRQNGFQHVVAGPTLFDGIRGDGPFLYPYSIEFEDESTLVSLAVVDDSFVGLVRVDVATGNRTVVSGGGVGEGPDFLGLGYLTIVPAVVPEPSTTILGASALLTILAACALGRSARRLR